jgi:hypothetical protein
MLVTDTGPGGLCGSVLDQAGQGFPPCDDAIKDAVITASFLGGTVTVLGAAVVVVAFVVRPRTSTALPAGPRP